ncbi:MAG: class I SAM-dependent methyltransferase [Candidatus Melainabacteria bacterium]
MIPDPTPLLKNPDTKKVLEAYFVQDLFRHNPSLGQQALDCFVSTVQTPQPSTLKQAQASSVHHKNVYHHVGDLLRQDPDFQPQLEKARQKWEYGRVDALSRQVAELVRPLLPADLPGDFHYIDLGCGEAQVTRGIAQHLGLNADQVTPLEIDGQGHNTQASEPWGIRTYDGRKIPNNIPKADLITMLSVLHHSPRVEELRELVSQVYDHLKPGGILAIRDLDISTPQEKLFAEVKHQISQRIAQFMPINIPRDETYLSRHELETILKDVGFQLVDAEEDKMMEPTNITTTVNYVFRKPA